MSVTGERGPTWEDLELQIEYGTHNPCFVALVEELEIDPDEVFVLPDGVSFLAEGKTYLVLDPDEDAALQQHLDHVAGKPVIPEKEHRPFTLSNTPYVARVITGREWWMREARRHHADFQGWLRDIVEEQEG